MFGFLVAIALVALGLLACLCRGHRPPSSFMPHEREYFARLGAHLERLSLGRSVAVLDLDRVDDNCDRIRRAVPPALRLRLVTKSLPCVPLIRHVAERLGTELFMVFHPNMLAALLDALPARCDFLLGKPFPAPLADALIATLVRTDAARVQQIQWLVDTPERLGEYLAVARRHGVCLRISIEIDVRAQSRRGRHSPPRRSASVAAAWRPRRSCRQCWRRCRRRAGRWRCRA